MTYIATKQHVHNRGIPSDSFLNQLLDWGKTAPDEIFATNGLSDIYSSVFNTLGPWQDLAHRRAVMLEVLRVLAGFESSWNWNAGRDTSNPNSDMPEEIEAGAFQVSANSMNFGQELKDLVRHHTGGSLDPVVFQETMKSNHPLAIEYCARLLRRTTRHHGPVRDHFIDAWLRRDAVTEFQGLLGGTSDAGAVPSGQIAGDGVGAAGSTPYSLNLARIARGQYNEFHQFTESDGPLRVQIRRYWQELGFDFPGVETPWSAVFVSWCVQTAGATEAEFRPSTAHSRFVFRAIRNQSQGAGLFRGRRIEDYCPKVGDILHNNRGNQNITYDFAAAHEAYESHSAVVVETGSGFIRTVGGNEGDSVGLNRVDLTADGFVKQRHPNPYICLIENLKA